MNDNEQLRERLRWYIYECPYDEFNPQEVHHLIKELKENEDDYEKKVMSSHIIFKTKSIQDSEKKKPMKRKAIVAAFSGIAIAASIILAIQINQHTIAGLKNGYFNILKDNEEGLTFYISPDIVQRIYSAEELPEEFKEKIWIPARLIGYELTEIKTSGKDLVSARFDNSIEHTFIVFSYDFDWNLGSDDYILNEEFYLDDIEVSSYQSKSGGIDNAENVYYYCFRYSGTNYCIESNDLSGIQSSIDGFIDFIRRE